MKQTRQRQEGTRWNQTRPRTWTGYVDRPTRVIVYQTNNVEMSRLYNASITWASLAFLNGAMCSSTKRDSTMRAAFYGRHRSAWTSDTCDALRAFCEKQSTRKPRLHRRLLDVHGGEGIPTGESSHWCKSQEKSPNIWLCYMCIYNGFSLNIFNQCALCPV